MKILNPILALIILFSTVAMVQDDRKDRVQD